MNTIIASLTLIICMSVAIGVFIKGFKEQKKQDKTPFIFGIIIFIISIGVLSVIIVNSYTQEILPVSSNVYKIVTYKQLSNEVPIPIDTLILTP